MQEREEHEGADALAAECQAYLDGTLAEYWHGRGVDVPVWSWINLLAHGSDARIAACATRVQRPRRTCRDWRIARSYLACQMLDLTDARFTLADMQSNVLIPLELELAARPEFAHVTPRQLVDALDATLRTEHSRLSR